MDSTAQGLMLLAMWKMGIYIIQIIHFTFKHGEDGVSVFAWLCIEENGLGTNICLL